MPTRRQFLRRCSTAALTATIFPAAAIANGSLRGTVELNAIQYASFGRQAGTLFHVLDESGVGVFLRLIEVKPFSPVSQVADANAADARNERFSLLFSGPLNRTLLQGSYIFEHLGIGRFEMFIVPVGPDSTNPRYYEAVFNRPVGGATMPAGPVGSARKRKDALAR
jgi:hypothetical protein